MESKKPYIMFGFKAGLDREIYRSAANAPGLVKADYLFNSLFDSFKTMKHYIPAIGSTVVSESSRDGYAKAKVLYVTLIAWAKDPITHYIIGKAKEVTFTDNADLMAVMDKIA